MGIRLVQKKVFARIIIIKSKKQLLKKKTLCELDSTITLRGWYSNYKQGGEYKYNCSNSFSKIAAQVGVHMTNYLKNPYSPNDHWGYSWSGNSGKPSSEGHSYYHDLYLDNTIRIRTLCRGKIIEDTITIN